MRSEKRQSPVGADIIRPQNPPQSPLIHSLLRGAGLRPFIASSFGGGVAEGDGGSQQNPPQIFPGTKSKTYPRADLLQQDLSRGAKRRYEVNEYCNYPTEEEIREAVKACCGRCCKCVETPVEYAWRARDVDMSALLRLAVENELTPAEREAVSLRWFENLSNRETALRLGVSESAVSRTLSRAAAKLRKALGYAVFYQHNINSDAIIPAALERARAVRAAKLMKAENFAQQVKKQRLSRGYNENQVEKYAGVKRGRVRAIESGAAPSAEETARLCAFFAVSPCGADGKQEEAQ